MQSAYSNSYEKRLLPKWLKSFFISLLQISYNSNYSFYWYAILFYYIRYRWCYMLYIKILINALFIAAQIHVSTKYQYRRSFLVALSYTIYVIIILPYVTLEYIYLYLSLMLWLFFSACFFMRDRLFG